MLKIWAKSVKITVAVLTVALFCLSFAGCGEQKESADIYNKTPLTVEQALEAIEACDEGDSIYFGTYEQDNNAENGKENIEWIVLAKEDDRVLAVSRYVLDSQSYHTEYADVTWETCALRSWLNTTFIDSAFSEGEKALIPDVELPKETNPEFETASGNPTKDKVFLLSIDEVNKYFNDDKAKRCEPTEYAAANGVNTNNSTPYCHWWLRTPGANQKLAARVYRSGVVRNYGDYVHYDGRGIRPAMWITFK